MLAWREGGGLKTVFLRDPPPPTPPTIPSHVGFFALRDHGAFFLAEEDRDRYYGADLDSSGLPRIGTFLGRSVTVDEGTGREPLREYRRMTVDCHAGRPVVAMLAEGSVLLHDSPMPPMSPRSADAPFVVAMDDPTNLVDFGPLLHNEEDYGFDRGCRTGYFHADNTCVNEWAAPQELEQVWWLGNALVAVWSYSDDPVRWRCADVEARRPIP